jgi:Holliday junction resolvasome RuvABC endonuclease subunit
VPYVWGVDVATGHLAFGFADADAERRFPTRVATLTMATTAREGERLAFIAKVLRRQSYMLARRFEPRVIFVEQPSGHFHNLQLCYVTGVVQATLAEALPCPVWTVPSSRWKRATIGPGNASKDDVRRWVHENSQAMIESQDECDAYAIAEAGRSMLLADSWGAAA